MLTDTPIQMYLIYAVQETNRILNVLTILITESAF